MSWFIYSPESFPNENLMGKPMYTPEYLKFWGIQLPPIVAKTWTKLQDNWYNTVHIDWRDKAGTRRHVSGEDLMDRLKKLHANRGLVFLDHEPSLVEKAAMEKGSHETNLAFRMSQVEAYENAVREKEVTGTGRTKPTPYEDECYTLLGLTKPYSVEAMRAQRHPGEAVGEQIVAALDRLDKRRVAEAAKASALDSKGSSGQTVTA